jgi:hypothetical protein
MGENQWCNANLSTDGAARQDGNSRFGTPAGKGWGKNAGNLQIVVLTASVLRSSGLTRSRTRKFPGLKDETGRIVAFARVKSTELIGFIDQDGIEWA